MVCGIGDWYWSKELWSDVHCSVFFQAEDGIRDAQESRGLGDVYKRQARPLDEIDPRLRTRLLDVERCTVFAILAPSYRRLVTRQGDVAVNKSRGRSPRPVIGGTPVGARR